MCETVASSVQLGRKDRAVCSPTTQTCARVHTCVLVCVHVWVGCMQGGSQSPRCTHPFPIQAYEQLGDPGLRASCRQPCGYYVHIAET